MKGERQRHGFQFEDWLKKQFFDIFYTSKWDVPGELNPQHRGVPISIKTAKWHGSIYFGDALRQFDVNEPFDLVVAFWRLYKGKKKIVKITEVLIQPADWRKWWGSLERKDLEELDLSIKNREASHEAARRRAQEIKRRLAGRGGIVTLNPKIDSKTQRRLQCSIAFSDFFQQVVKEESPTEDSEFCLWGKTIHPPML